jgi:hypothetical protein
MVFFSVAVGTQQHTLSRLNFAFCFRSIRARTNIKLEKFSGWFDVMEVQRRIVFVISTPNTLSASGENEFISVFHASVVLPRVKLVFSVFTLGRTKSTLSAR